MIDKIDALWTLDDAIEVVKELEGYMTNLKIGYHCGLTGGCLYKGSSNKDIDIILYPHTTKDCITIENLKPYLEGFFRCPLEYRNFTGYDDKHVEMTSYKGKRVDLFFMS